MSALKSGELFAGVGGLGMAVDDVFGSDPAWFCEFDAAPSRVLAHHFPDVPNYGDVTKVDWATAPHVDVLAGGFPCQDVSLAGARRGMKDGTRSGLWSEYVKAIDTLRPDWVVIENARGLISARADSEVEPCPWCVGDGDDEYHLRALDAVLADLSRLGFDAEWTGLRAADVGAPHGRFRFFILAWPAERTAADATGGGRYGWSCSPLGGTLERVAAAGGSGEPGDLTLLPTPRTTDMNGAGAHGAGGLDLRTTVALLPTPMVGSSSPAAHGQISGDFRARMDQVIEQVTMMPTPRASRGGSATETMYGLGAVRDDEGDRQGNVTGEVSSWGPYAAAIARWESVVGRTAPAPVRPDGKGGKARLNPELTEWMMGWPAGWVTASAQLSRAEQLKACGNGVVPQQAAAALRMLLARPGVPSIRLAVSA
ncbi:DNA cytosine methyltransferase [Microbacterium sp. Leaf203]|uniref:DNA cytosine methyltransferase n=1 Tax=Microbacterium sp. Leaf203 TaxID=1735677 RepID=UPI0009E83C97|nr:DNA cytosine methyltransferase [Microbacterium sp. Leaf203]